MQRDMRNSTAKFAEGVTHTGTENATRGHYYINRPCQPPLLDHPAPLLEHRDPPDVDHQPGLVATMAVGSDVGVSVAT